MSGYYRIDLGKPSLLRFSGPDAVRFLNGQLTQDVRGVVAGKSSLPSCVTDAKGRLLFRVSLTECEGALWVGGLAEWAEGLEARLTRYLIADDVNVENITGERELVHFTGPVVETPAGVVSRESNRFGIPGTDWWIPAHSVVDFPPNVSLLAGDDLEALRIRNGIPVWGHELVEGMLPPEARLDETDISYHKGCYIGQEVISRIKSAGKVNKRLTRFSIPSEAPAEAGPLFGPEGAGAGELTSVSPKADGGFRDALGYLKRGATEVFLKAADGALIPVSSV